MKTQCVCPALLLVVVDSGGVNSKMASVCSNLSVEISCADVPVAWRQKEMVKKMFLLVRRKFWILS